MSHDKPSRRELLQVATAAGMLLASGGGVRGQTRSGSISQDDLLRFDAKGQVTLLHMTDCHAQLMPAFVREPSTNIGIGEARGHAPHISDRAFLEHFAVPPGSHQAYALSSADHDALARAWGRVGGMDRMATLVAAIRAERGHDRVLLLDGGDTLQGSFTALHSRGGDMVRVIEALGVEATTGHWEFTLGAARIAELYGSRAAPGTAKPTFLASNIVENDFDEPVFHAMRVFERGGVRIAVIGQAFPYTPIANPRWMFPKWSMGIREDEIRRNVAAGRRQGAEIVVLLSHNGFDVDRKLARRVDGIDVILSAHTHDALPRPLVVGRTLLIASGSHTKFLSRLDLEVSGGRVSGYTYALIPLLSDVIAPDRAMATLIGDIRRPHAAMLATPLATTETTLYRRDTFSGPLDDLILDAILAERDAEIAFSPGFRWGPTIMAGQAITWEDIYNATAMTYPACYRVSLTGRQIKDILEDVADNAFHPDPYYQQGGDMVRIGGLGFSVDVDAGIGRRIGSLRLLRSGGEPLDATRHYTVAGWASIAENSEGPPIWGVLEAYLRRHKTVGADRRNKLSHKKF